MRYHLTSVRMAIKVGTKKTQTTNVGEDMEEREPFYTVGGNIN